MNIKALKEKVLALNADIENLFNEVGYNKKDKLDKVTFDKDNSDEYMLHYEFYSVFSHLDYINSLMSYLQKPIISEGIIQLNGKGEYILNGINLKKKKLIEIMDFDENNFQFWKPIFIKEYSNLENKKARIRE